MVAFLAGVTAVGSVALITPAVRWYAFPGYTLLFVAFVLALRALILVFRQPRT